jgi:two-component system CheB/CheR fusion protein
MELDTLENKSIFELNNGALDIPKLRELLEDTLNKEVEFEAVEIRHSFLEVGEKVLLVNGKKVFQNSNKEEVILLAIEDVTEFKQAQQIISEREAWFRNMANNAPVMIWTTGTDGLCNFVNKTWLEFRGLSLNDAIHKSWATGAHPDDFDMCQNAFKTALDNKKDFDLKYRLQTANCEYKYVLTKAKPNYTTEGDYAGFIGSCIELRD